jgi:hypothetical protein
MMFAGAWEGLSASERSKLVETIASSLDPYRAAEGSLVVPGRSLVAAASA